MLKTGCISNRQFQRRIKVQLEVSYNNVSDVS